jgi:Mitochondrial small ribosomal subunit Rsm22
MLGGHLVRALEEDWRDTLDAVARARGWPTSRDAARLATNVAALSATYNDPSRASAAVKDAGAARLGFSFPRDVPKGAAAVRELVATGTLGVEGTLRVLDLGAGLGATTWGVVRALEAAGASGVVEATWVDADAQALEVAAAVVRARPRGALELRATTRTLSVGPRLDLPPSDLVLAGQVLSELDVGMADDARLDKHTTLVLSWLDRFVGAHGSLVVVEPALRDRSRHLHRIHDRLLQAGVTVFAPCLHAGACPALLHDGDWCHEDLPVDLPAWLMPVARTAGLRHEGLTFSYLVLRKDGRCLSGCLPPLLALGVRLRVVSGPMPSKGKREAFLCGELPSSVGAGRDAVRARAMRLDRDASAATAAWDVVSRGDVVTLEPPAASASTSGTSGTSGRSANRPDATGLVRISRDTVVTLSGGSQGTPKRTETR